MNINLSISIVTLCTITLLSSVVVLQDYHNKINRIFALLCFSIVAWIASNIFADLSYLGGALFWSKFAIVPPLFLPILFLYLVIELYYRGEKEYKKKITPFFIIAAIIIILAPTSLNIKSITLTQMGVSYVPGVLYFALFSHLTVGFVTSFYLLINTFRVSKNLEQKTQIKFIFVGTFLSVFFSVLANIILPILNYKSVNIYGPIMPLFFLIFTAYAIIKYHLFNIKVVAAELLTFAIWVAVLIQAIMADTINGKLLGGAILSFAIIAGIFLIKSVKKEVALREEIEQLAGRLKSVNRIMSHDIKNVLGKDKDMFGMLLDGSFGALSDQARPFLQQAHDDTKKLIRSVIVILESGHELVLKPEKFDFKEAVLEVARDVEPEATTKGLTLTTNIPEDGDYMLVGDRVQLVTHVLKNLVENAVNYTLTGGVTVELSKKEKSILFAVKDTGVGISDEDKPNMFKEGSHGKDSLKMNVHSTGYGLFSVKKIVDAHKGKVWFDTAPGKGTTFFVELPRG